MLSQTHAQWKCLNVLKPREQDANGVKALSYNLAIFTTWSLSNVVIASQRSQSDLATLGFNLC